MWKELCGIPAIAVRCFLCVFWAGDVKAWQAPQCTAAHKFRQDCSSFGILLVSHLQWECSSPVTSSWEILTAGASSHQELADGLLLLTDPCQGSGLSRDGWNKLYCICFFPEWAVLLSGVAGGCPWPVFSLANVDFVSGCCWILTSKSLWLQRGRVVRGKGLAAAMCAWSDPLPSARTSCQT